MGSLFEDGAEPCTPGVDMADHLHIKAHNFGIYKKNGKRAILQLDFPGEIILLIQRGHIKKTYTFEQLQHFDSEEGLHICLKFRDTDFEFDADNMEEKYTLCRLIRLILDRDEEEALTVPGGPKGVSVLPPVAMVTDKVIKEGVLEKKGNTTITTWNKRKLKVTPGEFSYYKPGVDLALNIVQIWEDICTVKRSGQHGFTVSVRNRVYSFRLLNDRSMNLEVEREEWVEAFQKAMRSKRNTFVALEKSPALETPKTAFSYPDIYPIEVAEEQSRLRKKSVDIAEDTVEQEQEIVRRDQEVTKHFSVHLSYVEKTTPLQPLPTAKRPKPPAFGKQDSSPRGQKSPEVKVTCADGSDQDVNDTRARDLVNKETQNTRPQPKPRKTLESEPVEYVNYTRKESTTMEVKIDFTEPEPDYQEESPVQPITSSSENTCSATVSSSYVDHSAQKSVTQLIQKQENANHSQSIKTQENININQSIKKQEEVTLNHSMQSNETTNVNHSTEKNLSLSIETKETKSGGPKSPTSPTKSVNSINNNNELKQYDPPPPKSPTKNVTDDEKYQHRPLPVPSPGHSPVISPGHSPVISPNPPPPPPPLKATKSGIKLKSVPKMKLKQVHWSKVPQIAVSRSMWKSMGDVTSRLDLKLLEDMFALQEKDYVNIQSQATLQKKAKNILLDGKRAQNLSIMFNGPKPDTVERLLLVLSSITEDEAFPVEKLNTLRRYQPTADDVELYRMYRAKRKDLHPVDRFMIDLCDIPALDIRLDLLLAILDFPIEFKELSEEVDELMRACDELGTSSSLKSVLEYVLAIGNYMNAKWSSGLGSHGFQVSSIDKVLDVKSREPHVTFVHFLVQQISATNRQLLDWTSGVRHVRKCSDISIKAVGAEVDVLRNVLHKIKRNLKTLRNTVSSPSKHEKKYVADVQGFITEYEKKLEKLNSRCVDVNKKYFAILELYGENNSRTSDVLFSSVSQFADKFIAAREKR